jgi:hypothetical protein
MSQFVNRNWSLLESLGVVDWSVFRGWKVVCQLGECLCHLDWFLVVDQMPGTAIYRLDESDAFSTARCVQVVDGRGSWQRRCQLEILHRVHRERCSAKLILRPLCCTVYEWFGAIASIVDRVVGAFYYAETEVEEEFVGFVEVLVGIVDMREALQVDLLVSCR